MRDLTKSMTSFSWALSLFGARQMLNLMHPSRAAGAFESMARAAEGQLDEGLGSAFRTGDRLQRTIVDAAFGWMGGGMIDPTAWTRAGRRAMDCAERAAHETARPAPGPAASPAAGQGPEAGHDETTGGWGPVPG